LLLIRFVRREGRSWLGVLEFCRRAFIFTWTLIWFIYLRRSLLLLEFIVVVTHVMILEYDIFQQIIMKIQKIVSEFWKQAIIIMLVLLWLQFLTLLGMDRFSLESATSYSMSSSNWLSSFLYTELNGGPKSLTDERLLSVLRVTSYKGL